MLGRYGVEERNGKGQMVVELAKDGNDYGEHIFQEEGTSRGV